MGRNIKNMSILRYYIKLCFKVIESCLQNLGSEGNEKKMAVQQV